MRTLMLVAVLLVCWIAPESIAAQSVDRLELGVQVSAMRLSGVDVTDSGVGARVAWNLNETVAFEVVGDVFPMGKFNVPRGGRKVLALGGPKISWRSERVGVFAKARTGFARVGEGKWVGVCIAIFPPPEGCFTAETRLAFDLGGGVEVFPSHRTSLRFDIGSIVTRLGRMSQRFGNGGEYARDLHIAAGAGVRF